jgi:mono/diheme cytochrome c family protein
MLMLKRKVVHHSAEKRVSVVTSRNSRYSTILVWSVLLALPLLVSGCAAEPEPEEFEPNLVHALKYQIQEDIPMAQASEDANWVVTTMFGTPDEPRLPEVVLEDEELSQVVSMDHLVRASGPEYAEGRGLYRLLCASCHGVTGNGRGPVGAAQVPYPRDYRMGVFKFKSTPRGAKPTKADLKQLIKHGIAGTNMTSVDELLDLEKLKRSQMNVDWLPEKITDEDVDALVDYVIYLSWRGEHERTQIDIGVLEGILDGETRLINADYGSEIDWQNREARDEWDAKIDAMSEKGKDALSEAEQEELEKAERFEEDWGYAEEYAIEIGESWLEAEDRVIEVPDPPADLPVAESYADAQKILDGDQASAFEASVKRGQELFVGKVAACSKCHGPKGLGDGQTTDFDDWTKDWTTRVGLKPEDYESLVPLLARGAMPPLNAMPRNFAEGVFRGGSSSKDLYLRITQGIDGSPMPAATFVEGEFEKEDVWHLINFIRSLQTEETPADEAPAESDEKGGETPAV